MKKIALCVVLAAAALVAAHPTASAQDAAVVSEARPTYRYAVFVKNRDAGIPDEKVSVLEDQLAALLADEGFSLIRREDVLNAVSSFATQGPNAGRGDVDLDTVLSDNTSALRLAQNLNADFLLTASLTSLETQTRTVNAYGLNRRTTEHTLRTSVAVLGRASGGAVTGDVVVSTVRRPDSANVQITGDVLDGLIADAARQAAEVLAAKGREGRVGEPEDLAADTPFFVNALMSDLNFPEIVRDDEGGYVLTANTYQVQAFGVEVELDGLVIGSTPGPFEVAPGLHKMRLRRTGFEDWQGTVNVRPGTSLTIAMRMTPEYRRNFLEQAEFFNDLKRGERLNDAQIKAIEGFGQFLSNSEVKIGLTDIGIGNVNLGGGGPYIPDFLNDVSYPRWLERFRRGGDE